MPFLIGAHHPAVGIDIKKKHIVYVDPLVDYRHPDAIQLKAQLQTMAESIGFKFEEVKTKQQDDNSSCGPIKRII